MDLSDDLLVDTFGNAALRAGQSSSAVVINPGATTDWENMQKWRAALKDRLRQLREIERAHKEKCNDS